MEGTSNQAPREAGRGARQRIGQLGWLLAIWAASVLALGAVAFLLRLLMGVAGLTR